MLKEVVSQEFDQLQPEGLVLADFFSSTCGPCKMLSFVLKDVEKALGDQVNILKIDFDKNKDQVEKYGVKGYPTLIVFKDGQELERVSGLQQKPAIIKMVEKYL